MREHPAQIRILEEAAIGGDGKKIPLFHGEDYRIDLATEFSEMDFDAFEKIFSDFLLICNIPCRLQSDKSFSIYSPVGIKNDLNKLEKSYQIVASIYNIKIMTETAVPQMVMGINVIHPDKNYQCYHRIVSNPCRKMSEKMKGDFLGCSYEVNVCTMEQLTNDLHYAARNTTQFSSDENKYWQRLRLIARSSDYIQSSKDSNNILDLALGKNYFSEVIVVNKDKMVAATQTDTPASSFISLKDVSIMVKPEMVAKGVMMRPEMVEKGVMIRPEMVEKGAMIEPELLISDISISDGSIASGFSSNPDKLVKPKVKKVMEVSKTYDEYDIWRVLSQFDN